MKHYTHTWMRPPYSLLALGLTLFCLTPFISKGQLTVNASVTAVNAVQNILLGGGVTATNITFAPGNQNTQIGSFNCNNCGLGIASGVVMGTGHINGAMGPNSTGSQSVGPPNGSDGVSDPDLAALSGSSINNAAVLKFNFIPTGDSLAFRFVFGSEEYPEYVNSINDVFGFFISGPGISGPFTNNSKNIALIPNTTLPVSINTVNPTTNSSYYKANNGQYNVQADGFTTVLTARTPVICGATYQIKIAIGDASDGGWDSWVFLEAGSFQSNNVEISYTAPNISPSGSGIFEGCETAYINFTRPANNSATEEQFGLSFTGVAINGIDFEEIPEILTFPAGVTTVSLPVVAIADGVTEGNETFTLTVLDLGCNSGDPVSIDIMITDLPQLNVNMPDITINCGDQAVLTPEITGGLGNYQVTWENGLVQPSLSTYPSGPVSYAFTVTDTCGVAPFTGVANVLFVQNPPLVVDIGSNIAAQCLDEIIITSNVTGGYGDYNYTWTTNGTYYSDQPNFEGFYGNTTQAIQLSVTDLCGVTATDLIQLTYPPVPVTAYIGDDITATCIVQSLVTSQVTGGVGNYNYSWTLNGSPLGYSSAVSVQTPVTATLVLNVNDQCGNTATDQLTVTIPPVNVILDIGPNVVATCLDNITNSAIQLENGVGNYSYVWTNNGVNTTTGPQYAVQTGTTCTIGLTVTDQCGNSASDSRQIIIPPAPIALTVFPQPDTMICLGTWAKLGALATGGVGTLTYTWTGIHNTPTNTANSSIVQESPASNTSYTVAVNDQCGNSNSGIMRVNVRELFPQFEAEYVSDTEVRFENTSAGNDVFTWTFGDGSTSQNHQEIVNFLGAPEWKGTLTVFSPEGCSKSITQEFTAIGDLFVPNCFTPDHDGVNDFFFVVGHDLRYFELTIFNRYGEVVFKSYDINEPWDGSYQGQEHFVPNGVYNYQLVAIGKRENTIERKGRITLFR